MERTFKHLTKADRIRIEALIKAGVKIKEIADMLHVQYQGCIFLPLSDLN